MMNDNEEFEVTIKITKDHVAKMENFFDHPQHVIRNESGLLQEMLATLIRLGKEAMPKVAERPIQPGDTIVEWAGNYGIGFTFAAMSALDPGFMIMQRDDDLILVNKTMSFYEGPATLEDGTFVGPPETS